MKFIATLLFSSTLTRLVLGARHFQSRFVSSPPSSQPINMVKILLIGDSLTEGYYHNGMRFHSYANKLEELLYSKFPNKINSNSEMITNQFLIEERGVSGELTSQISHRLTNILDHNTNNPKETPYDIVCILGGTNDLGYELAAQSIFQNLQGMYDRVKQHNPKATLVAITIPQSYVEHKEYIATRKEVNARILQYGAGGEGVVHVDLEHLLPYFTTTGGETEKQEKNHDYWDDGLHMNSNGYDKFGELVFDAIGAVLQKNYLQPTN